MTTARRRNPERRADQQEAIDKASRLLEDFSGHAPTHATPVDLPTPEVGLVVGELDGVLYTTIRDGKRERYVHEFRPKSRPLLAADSDGKTLHIVGGQYEFTDAGIVDR
jgi:hypothetical protein